MFGPPVAAYLQYCIERCIAPTVKSWRRTCPLESFASLFSLKGYVPLESHVERSFETSHMFFKIKQKLWENVP